MTLSPDWKPEPFNSYGWFCMDKNGEIAIFFNNGFGELPKSLLQIANIEHLLTVFCDFFLSDSPEFSGYIKNKNGDFIIDFYSKAMFKLKLKDQVVNTLNNDLKENGRFSEIYPVTNCGFYIFYAVEGPSEGDDYPVGYEGKTQIGDYFRFLVPTKTASISDIPPIFYKVLCVSNELDFRKDRILRSSDITNRLITMYQS